MPVDSKFFDKINDAQIMWYQIQTSEDEKENFELLRDVAEHNAMFMNPEGVQKIRDSRENTFSLSNNQFDNVIKEHFGKELPNIKKEKDEIDTYLNMNLDEIKFIPFGDD